MQQNGTRGSACCFTSQPAIDPTSVDNVVTAGSVCSADGCVPEAAPTCKLAIAYFPMQAYRAGYCPAKALQCGTLFPDLVSPYATACTEG